MKEVDELYFVSVDISKDDEPTAVVAKSNNGVLEFINQLTGKEAILLYDKLKGKTVSKPILVKDFGISCCPSCEHNLNHRWLDRYCPSCGQQLDWSAMVKEVKSNV